VPETAVFQPEKARKIGLRAAINLACRQCIYDPHAMGAWRQQVEACTAPDCGLYPVRPRSSRPLSGAQDHDCCAPDVPGAADAGDEDAAPAGAPGFDRAPAPLSSATK